MTFYIFIYGSTATGTGKTIFSSSLAYLFSTYGLSTSIVKFDGILNISIDNMFASRKGKEIIWEGEEVFITKNGEKVDSDIGNYERFLNRDLTAKNNILNGACYYLLIKKQLEKKFSKGDFIGLNKDLIPIYLEKINLALEKEDVGIIEVGGTIGDEESTVFLKALRSLKNRNPFSCLTICYSYLPLKSYTNITDEEPFLLKTVKSSYEQSIKSGLPPDILAIRSDKNLSSNQINRIIRDTFLEEKKIIQIPTVNNPYDLPIKLIKEGKLTSLIQGLFPSKTRIKGHLEDYFNLKTKIKKRVLIMGETESSGTYISLNEAVKHALKHLGAEADIVWFKRNKHRKIDSNYDYIIITEGNKDLKDKIKIIRNSIAKVLCIGNVNKIFKKIKCKNIIEEHKEYRSRPMRPSLLNFFRSK